MQLEQTLSAIGESAVPQGMSAEVLVVDNGSMDRTSQVVKTANLGNMKVQYLREDRLGKGHAYNFAMAHARGEVFIFTDDDVRPTKNWLEGMSRPILESKADGVQGAIKIPPHLRRPWMQRFHLELLASTEFIERDVAYFIGANMAFGRHVLRSVPTFDPALGPGALGFGEESLFSSQMKEAGMRIVNASDAVVEHHFDSSRLSSRSFRDRARRDGHSRAYVSYHWLHEDHPDAAARLKVARSAAIRGILRHPLSRLLDAVMSEEEFWLHISLGFWEQTVIEQQKPRRYAKRGLRLLELSTSESPANFKMQADCANAV